MPAAACQGAACVQCRSKNVAQYNFCSQCGSPWSGGQRAGPADAPRPLVIDQGRLNVRRSKVQAAMDGRPGQRRTAKVAKDFDAFIHSRSGGRSGRDAATLHDVLIGFVSETLTATVQL